MFKKLLILLSVICTMFAAVIISLPFINKANLETKIKSMDQMQINYTSTESNTWDISENGDGSVIATLDENGLLTISGTDNMENWYSSSNVPWYSVREQIKQVNIQEGVTSIGPNAFNQCSSLTKVTIPSSVTTIRSNAFSNCGSLTNIEIPEGVTILEFYVFAGCDSLTQITIPSSVTSIGEFTFMGCVSLDNIKVAENNIAYYVNDGVLYTKDNTKIIKYPVSKQDSTYSILSEVTSIGSYAFEYCTSLTEIIIPEGLTNIGNGAFYGCSSLTEINIPRGVTLIGESAFDRCSSLTEVTIPEGIKSISEKTFKECSSLTEIIIPEGVTSIGGSAFSGCSSLTEIIIPSSVTSIGTFAFSRCSNLANISVDSNNTKYCDVDGVLYTNDKTEIIKYPEGKKDTVYTILDGVTIIGNSSFNKGCSYLKQIIIPKSVTTIGNGLFKGNDQLTILCYKNSATEQYAKENNLKYMLLDGLTSTDATIDEEKQMVKGVKPKTTIEEIKTSILSGVAYEILDKEGNAVEDTSIIGTGYVIKLSDDQIYTLIVMGDLNGDGKIGIAELARTSRLGISQEGASEIEIIAIDINMDGNIKVNDIAAISRMARE